jgi:hypothetical protein
MSEPSDAPYRNSVIIMPENVSPFEDSSLLRSWWEKKKKSRSDGHPMKQRRMTYLTFVSINDHCHPFHIDSVLDDTLKASLQLGVKGIEMLCGHRSDIDR